ncbi:MAG: hypothetical protein N2257_03780 [Thermodesulfovibrionales bacterium]|nr:hypothetical protein [Thermodesulfovibrionales bacterium]
MLRKNIFYVLLILLTGCTPSYEPPVIEPKKECPEHIEPNFLLIFREYAFIPPEEFGPKVKGLEALLSRKNLSDSDKGLYHLRLSILFSHFKNPKVDYNRALKELELYLLLSKDEDKLVQFYLDLLREIVRLDKEGKELRHKLELLKGLDLDIEKKRIKPR